MVPTYGYNNYWEYGEKLWDVFWYICMPLSVCGRESLALYKHQGSNYDKGLLNHYPIGTL